MTKLILCHEQITTNNAHYCINCDAINGQVGIENKNHEQ